MKNYVQTLANDVFPLLSLSIMIFTSLSPQKTLKKDLNSSKGVVSLSGMVELKADKTIIAGNSGKEIYLWNNESTTLSGFDIGLNQLEKHVLNKVAVANPQENKVVADSSFLYMYNSVMKCIFAMDNKNGQTRWLKFYHRPFNEMVPADSEYVVLRMGADRDMCELVKCPVKDFSKRSYRYVVGPGSAKYDGVLLYDKCRKKIVYVYDEEFLCFDKNLNLEYKSQKMKGTGNHKQCCISDGLLYVRSATSLIDVYDVEDGHYCFSFDIPDFNRENLKDFRISNQHLLALYDKFLISYYVNGIKDGDFAGAPR